MPEVLAALPRDDVETVKLPTREGVCSARPVEYVIFKRMRVLIYHSI